MSTTSMAPITEIKAGNFEGSARQEAGTLQLRLAGSADQSSREALSSLLARLHADALRLNASSVVVDCTRLEFMNSSCIKEFVRWLAGVQDLDALDQYKIRFLSRREVLWQRRSFQALRCFAADLVTVDTK